MKTERYQGRLIALSPIHHGGDESTGSRATLRRMKFIQRDGTKTDIPVISGNSIRGVLRRLVMRDMLDSIDYKLTNIKAYHMLFAGGTLESVSSKDSGNINLDLRKRLRETIPALSIFGSAVSNQMIEGKMKCAYAIPICTETEEFIKVQPQNISTYEQLTDDFTTRRDDIKADREDNESAHQMIVNFEVFAPGTQFYHKFTLLDCNPVETAVLGRALELWKDRPFVGGKSSIGMGEVLFDYDAPDSTDYTDYLRDNQAAIIEAIKEIEDILK